MYFGKIMVDTPPQTNLCLVFEAFARAIPANIDDLKHSPNMRECKGLALLSSVLLIPDLDWKSIKSFSGAQSSQEDLNVLMGEAAKTLWAKTSPVREILEDMGCLDEYKKLYSEKTRRAFFKFLNKLSHESSLKTSFDPAVLMEKGKFFITSNPYAQTVQDRVLVTFNLPQPLTLKNVA